MVGFRGGRRAARAWRVAAFLSGVELVAGLAHAESGGGIDRPMADADRTTEVAFGVGNHLGIGSVAGSPVRLQELSGGGTTLELGVGYRLMPAVLLGAYATGSWLSGSDAADQDSSVVPSSAGLQVNWHARPAMLLDPWIGYGMGWRGIWLKQSAGTTTSQGVDLARVQAGLDFRLASSFALAPVIGADWSLGLWDDAAPASSPGAHVNAILFAGVLARLQMFGP